MAPIQILAGDQHGLNTLEHQPAKVMAMEGHFRSHKNGAPLILFGLARRTRRQGEIRDRGAEAVVADPEAFASTRRLPASTRVPRENWPPVPITFWAFRIMVGLGFLIHGARPVQPADALARP